MVIAVLEITIETGTIIINILIGPGLDMKKELKNIVKPKHMYMKNY